MADADYEASQQVIRIPQGEEITEPGPIVIVGPNGSGKTRRSRTITSDVEIEVVSALRITKISQQLQPMALPQAKNDFRALTQRSRSQPYEPASDFDVMLTALIGEAAEVGLDYLAASRKDDAHKLPALSPLEEIQSLWGKFFPGRELKFKNYMPQVVNNVAVGDEPKTYSAWEMSDGEKAALYLAGRALTADKGTVLLVDEPETHFHSLLAVQFWDAIEVARPDLRLIYVTHDMTFAASRKAVRYLLANPKNGLTPIELSAEAGDVAAVLLGTASLSFYANRVIFCEGDSEGLDSRLYNAWFSGKEDVVQAVGSCDMVFRSVSALASTNLVANLTVQGVIDRDFRSDDELSALPSGVVALGVHEVETLFALPDVVEAVAAHLKIKFDRAAYEARIIATYQDSDRHTVSLERWKTVVAGKLGSIVSGVSAKNTDLTTIIAAVPSTFDQKNWDFSPQGLLQDEKDRVEGIFQGTPSIEEILRIMPGKQLRSLPASALGFLQKTYDNLVIKAVGSDDEDVKKLRNALRKALSPYLAV